MNKEKNRPSLLFTVLSQQGTHFRNFSAPRGLTKVAVLSSWSIFEFSVEAYGAGLDWSLWEKSVYLKEPPWQGLSLGSCYEAMWLYLPQNLLFCPRSSVLGVLYCICLCTSSGYHLLPPSLVYMALKDHWLFRKHRCCTFRVWVALELLSQFSCRGVLRRVKKKKNTTSV